jgi:hypothetical protein
MPMPVTLKVQPPPAVAHLQQATLESKSSARIRASVDPVGTDSERFLFRMHYEQIAGILHSLQELCGNATITCSIRDGNFQAVGRVHLWFNGAEQAVQHALRLVNDHGWQAARLSKRSSADIHAVVTKVLLAAHAS